MVHKITTSSPAVCRTGTGRTESVRTKRLNRTIKRTKMASKSLQRVEFFGRGYNEYMQLFNLEEKDFVGMKILGTITLISCYSFIL